MPNLSILENLNDKQIAAIVYTDGPSIIIAGAGVGKTRVLTHKIAYLISVLKIDSQKILALTFTNKSAKEMKVRVANILQNPKLRVNIATYHALCAKILRIDSSFLDINPNFNIIDTNDQKQILKSIYLKDFNNKADQNELRLLSSFISQWKNNFLDKQDIVTDYYDQPEWVLRAKVYEKYLEYQKSNYCLDFDDLLLLVYKLFTKHPEVLIKWQRRFQFVLVDEFQDTNNLQYNILCLLVKKHHNLTVVGDPDQTIYSWRGANISLILKFTNLFNNAKTFILDQNYRSTTKILNTANSLIKNNLNRIEKNLFTTNNLGEDVVVFHAINSIQEANWVASVVKSLNQKQHIKLNQIAILYRNNYLSRELEQAFITQNINYKVVGGFKFFERKEIKDVLAYLKIIAWSDNLSTIRILNNIPKIGAKTIDNFLAEAESANLSLISYLDKNENNLGKNQKIILQPFIELIRNFKDKLVFVSSIYKLVEELLVETEYLKRLENNFENERVENVKQLLAQLLEYDTNNENLAGNEMVSTFLQEVSLYSTSDEEVAVDAVNFMTIHSAKGLEFKIVFVIGINEGILPGVADKETLSQKEQEKLEEERRLLYVAITRAKKILFLSSASGFSYVLNRHIYPSRFFNDLTEEHLKIISSNEYDDSNINEAQTTRFKFNQSFNKPRNTKIINKSENKLWKVHDVINHDIFGQGVITKIIGDKIEVAFQKNKGGIKILSSTHPAITKVR